MLHNDKELREEFEKWFNPVKFWKSEISIEDVINWWLSKLAAYNEAVVKILKRHSEWKPTEGHGSDEERGYQKGLMAEAKLIEKEILALLKEIMNKL